MLSDLAVAAETWLLSAMAPLWTGAGFDERAGQFVEALSADGVPTHAPRRALVQARQMVTCCIVGRMGWRGPWAERTAQAGEALLARGRSGSGDWIYSFDLDGGPLDARTDLYTQAFAILGFSEAGRSLRRPDFIAAAEETWARLETGWSDANGGFREGEIAPHPGRQNPHMHLLEAALALHAATGARESLERAERIGAFFAERLVIPDLGVPEEFDEAWAPIPQAGMAPGHQFEWAWLLDRLRAAGGADRTGLAWALAASAEGRGVDAGGYCVDLVTLDGDIRAPTARLWPQAERLKCLLALRESGEPAATQATRALLSYLDPPTRGAWRDLRLADGTWRDGDAPASSGYHIAGAIQALRAAVSD